MWIYRKDYAKPLSKPKQDYLIGQLANGSGLEDFPTYLEQCITNARNKYLYTNDPIFKGSIMAYTFLKEEIKNKKVKSAKKELTQEEKIGIMKSRGY